MTSTDADIANQHVSPTRDTVESTLCDVVGIVAHDLRAPLTVIKGYLDILERPMPEHERHEALTHARSAANRMRGLLDDLVASATAKDLLTPRTFESVSLRMVAEEVVSGLAAIGDTRFELDADCAGTVLGEERRLHQVLMNVLTNAIEHSPEGGRVLVRLRCADGRIVCSVEDEGPGIPAEERDRVFGRLERLDGESRRPGTGLGLYIVKSIVDAHDGTVSICSATTLTGTCVCIDLPAAPD